MQMSLGVGLFLRELNVHDSLRKSMKWCGRRGTGLTGCAGRSQAKPMRGDGGLGHVKTLRVAGGGAGHQNLLEGSSSRNQ